MGGGGPPSRTTLALVGILCTAASGWSAAGADKTARATRPFVTRRTGALTLGIKDDPVGSVFTGLFPGNGKQIYFGVLQRDVPCDCDLSEDERAARRVQAARDLVNIDQEERDRRQMAGTIGAVLTAVLAASLLVSHAGPLTRLAIDPPFALSYGYLMSAKEGLWNIAQASVWDVDGTGMQKIEDDGLAQRLRDKVNAFNLDSVKVSVAATSLFVVLPEIAANLP
jgi:hypothetical protein